MPSGKAGIHPCYDSTEKVRFQNALSTSNPRQKLLPATRIGHIVPGLESHLLMSVVTLCNTDCTVEFSKIGCTVRYQGKTVLRGHKCLNSGLWMANLQGDATNPPAGSKLKAALNTATDKLETLLWKFQMAQQVSQEQAENHFFDPKTVFQRMYFPYKSSSWRRK